MHELSIARSLVRVCEDAAEEQRAVRVSRVYLRLGPLSGVVREALEFAYDYATDGTLLAGSELVVEPVPVVARCEPCARDVEPAAPNRLRCPHCDEPTPTILSGRELLVRAIDYDEAPGDVGASDKEKEDGAPGGASSSSPPPFPAPTSAGSDDPAHTLAQAAETQPHPNR